LKLFNNDRDVRLVFSKILADKYAGIQYHAELW